MSLAGQVTLLAQRIATEINKRGMPKGGAAGQVLAKTSATDFAGAWVAPGFASTLVVASQQWTTGKPVLGGGLVSFPVAEQYDPSNLYDGQFYTCPAAGYYLVIVRANLDDNVVNNVSWGLSSDVGATLNYFAWTKSTSGASTNRNTHAFSRIMSCNSGDKLRALFYADSNAGLTITGIDFEIVRVA